MSLVKGRSKSGFNKLTLTLAKTKNNKIVIKKRASLVFSKEYYTPELATTIAFLKTINFENNVEWTILAITGPKEQFKLRIVEPFNDNDFDIQNDE